MSAFIVGKEHIDAMLASVLSPRDQIQWEGETGTVRYKGWSRLDFTSADAVGQMLWNENVKSVLHRYPGDTLESAPGPIETVQPDAYTFPLFNAPRPTAVQGLKLLSCYEYQSCEHPGWETSEAKRFCTAARHHLISELPGYEAAPWEWTASIRQAA